MAESREPCPARVRVPASTSNLGAGFDSVGLALDRYVTATYDPGPGPLRLERDDAVAAIDGGLAAVRRPSHPADAPLDADLLTRAFRKGLGCRGVAEFGGVLGVHSDIPVARGLGSSGAAVVAGFALAAAAAGDELDRSTMLDQAVQWEGHPDNAAPALFGGLVAAARDGQGRSHAFPLPLSEDIDFAFAAPGVRVSTAQARTALPQHVAVDLAARGLGRLAALLRGLALADPSLIRIGFFDELHVPHRLPLIPGAATALDAALEAGAWATTISGSGSGLIAVCPPGRAPDVAAAMADAFGHDPGDEGVVSFAVRPDRQGAQVGENVSPAHGSRSAVAI